MKKRKCHSFSVCSYMMRWLPTQKLWRDITWVWNLPHSVSRSDLQGTVRLTDPDQKTIIQRPYFHLHPTSHHAAYSVPLLWVTQRCKTNFKRGTPHGTVGVEWSQKESNSWLALISMAALKRHGWKWSCCTLSLVFRPNQATDISFVPEEIVSTFEKWKTKT